MVAISERAALLSKMRDEEDALERQIEEAKREIERLRDRRDAIRCCRVALERE